MLNVVMMLAKTLVAEALVLLMALAVILFILIKNTKLEVGNGQGFLGLLKIELRDEFSTNEKYIKLYEIALLIYWIMILTSVWCFTVLLGFIFTLGLAELFIIMAVELMIVYSWMRRRVNSNGDNIKLIKFLDSKLGYIQGCKSVRWVDQKIKHGIFNIKGKVK